MGGESFFCGLVSMVGLFVWWGLVLFNNSK